MNLDLYSKGKTGYSGYKSYENVSVMSCMTEIGSNLILNISDPSRPLCWPLDGTGWRENAPGLFLEVGVANTGTEIRSLHVPCYRPLNLPNTNLYGKVYNELLANS